MEDLDLFNGLKTGNRKIIREIYDRFLPQVKMWIKNNGGNDADAHDLFQETLETILLKIEKLHSSFGGLLMQISKNKWIDKIRKDQTQKKVRTLVGERQDNESHSEKKYIEAESEYLKYKLMEKTFQALSETCQQLMRLIKSGKAVKEIVVEMQMNSANTLYRRKAACMERWTELLRSENQYKTYFQ